MECNKDEAKRAMDIAERKVTERDYNGARKFANKAQNLYPELDGLKQLLMSVDVYISGEKQINGEADWYAILGVDPLSDDEIVRKQYRKLALMLHPDKNKCQGAEGAFKLISEAWSLLSDKAKRSSYNKRRNVREAAPPQRPSGFPVPPHQPSSNGFQNVKEHVVLTARAKTKPAPRMDRSNMDPPESAQKETSTTFWTMCIICKTQYEYMRVYLNQTLLCPNCRKGFVAVEKTAPSNVTEPVNLSSNRNPKTQPTKKKTHGGGGATSSSAAPAPSPAPSVKNDFRWESLLRMAGYNGQNQAANVVQEAQDRIKRKSQERDAARGFTDSDLRNFKKPRTTDNNPFMFTNPEMRYPNIQGILLPSHITKGLVNKAKSDISKMLQKITTEKVLVVESVKAATVVEVERHDVGSVEEVSNDSDPLKVVTAVVDEVNAIVVPDSDFHDFDLDRSERSFQEDQIWAAYDDDDGMPRFYARIQKVISVNPFKMRISWLNSKNCNEFSDIDWIGSGFAKSCGDFRTGRYEPTDTLNAFSHKVDFTKGVRGFLHILPKKGQVWALYRNWSSEWDKSTTPDQVIHKYDMVEVMDDYSKDKQSLTVALLVKVQGFKAVFRTSADHKDVRMIAKEEMFRFSHQVPHYVLTGKEADNAPEGCLELDPAATPCELLSVNGGDMEDKTESVKVERSAAHKEQVPVDL